MRPALAIAALLSPDGEKRITGYTTDVITDLAIEWLEGRDPDRPFLLMCQHKAPHRNWQPGPRHLDDDDGREIPEPDDLFDDWSGRSSAARTQLMTVAKDLNDADLKLVPPRGLDDEQLTRWKAAYLEGEIPR